MSILLYTVGVISFIAALLISIGLHELGHLIPAKKFGALVPQYFIGFGKTLWSFKRNGTEYGIKWIPLGGYVKITGMMPPVKNNEGKDSIRDSDTGLFTNLINSSKKLEYETIDVKDHDSLFYKLPWWKKFIVMVSGPSVNILLAFICFLGVFTIYGERTMEAPPRPPTIQTVSQCALPPYGTNASNCSKEHYTPAYEMGLLPGDTIITFNDKKLESWDDLWISVQANPNKKANLTIIRGEEELLATGVIKEFTRPSNNDFGKNFEVGFLGVSPVLEERIEYLNALDTVIFMSERTRDTFKAISQIPPKVGNVFLAILGITERDPNGPVSMVGGARFSGEVAAYDSTDKPVEINMNDKIAMFFMLIGAVNLFIGVLNLLPILPLDGGHAIGALYEGFRNHVRKIFKKKTSPVDVAKMLPIAYSFGMTLFSIGLILIVGDIVVPIRLLE